jgi:predicted amidohydrolase
MKISVAQTTPIKGNILANVETHKKLIDLAIANNADAIFFPELSITGYEPELVKTLAISEDDKCFDEFQQISNIKNITVAFGVPTKSSAGIKISMLIFQPDLPKQIYSKQQLHEDEFPFFVLGDKQIILNVKGGKIAPAICYESLQNNHAENANNLGAEMYVTSVAKTQNGIDKAMAHYPEIAKKFSMPVLMSNCVGHCDNFESIGNTAVWNKQGNMLAQLDNTQEGILVFDTETEEVIKKFLPS